MYLRVHAHEGNFIFLICMISANNMTMIMRTMKISIIVYSYGHFSRINDHSTEQMDIYSVFINNCNNLQIIGNCLYVSKDVRVCAQRKIEHEHPLMRMAISALGG